MLTFILVKGPSQPKTPGLSRSNSQTSLRPSLSRPGSAASSRPATLSRATSASIPLQDANGVNGSNGTNGATPKRVYGTDSGLPFKPAARPSSIDAPAIAPRTNRSTALRAAKQAEEAAAARKYGRPKPRPSSVAVMSKS